MSTRELIEPITSTAVELDGVLAVVGKRFRVHVIDIVANPGNRGSPRKGDEASRDARNVAMFIAKNRRHMMSLAEIGRRFNCDKTSVLSACDRIQREIHRRTPIGVYAQELLDKYNGHFEVDR